MNCDVVREEMSAYMDQELDSAMKVQVEAHLAGCAECRKELTVLQQVDKVLDRYAVPAAPSGFSKKVLRQTHTPLRRSSPIWKAAAAVVLVATGASLYWVMTEAGEAAIDEKVMANLDVLEHWEMLNDPNVQLVLSLPDEEREELMESLGEGM